MSGAAAGADLRGGVLAGGFGFDYAFEAVGRPGTLRAAYDATRLGGTVCLVGAGSRTDLPDISMGELVMSEKAILPSFYGGDDIRRTYGHDHRPVARGPYRPGLDDHAPRAADGDQRGAAPDAHR